MAVFDDGFLSMMVRPDRGEPLIKASDGDYLPKLLRAEAPQRYMDLQEKMRKGRVSRADIPNAALIDPDFAQMLASNIAYDEAAPDRAALEETRARERQEAENADRLGREKVYQYANKSLQDIYENVDDPDEAMQAINEESARLSEQLGIETPGYNPQAHLQAQELKAAAAREKLLGANKALEGANGSIVLVNERTGATRVLAEGEPPPEILKPGESLWQGGTLVAEGTPLTPEASYGSAGGGVIYNKRTGETTGGQPVGAQPYHDDVFSHLSDTARSRMQEEASKDQKKLADYETAYNALTKDSLTYQSNLQNMAIVFKSKTGMKLTPEEQQLLQSKDAMSNLQLSFARTLNELVGAAQTDGEVGRIITTLPNQDLSYDQIKTLLPRLITATRNDMTMKRLAASGGYTLSYEKSLQENEALAREKLYQDAEAKGVRLNESDVENTIASWRGRQLQRRLENTFNRGRGGQAQASVNALPDVAENAMRAAGY